MINCMSNRNDMIIHLIVGLIKISQYLPKPFRSFIGNINIKFDLSNYAAKTDLKNLKHFDTSNFTLKQT